MWLESLKVGLEFLTIVSGIKYADAQQIRHLFLKPLLHEYYNVYKFQYKYIFD